MAGHAGIINTAIIHKLTKYPNDDAILVYGNKNLIGPYFDKITRLEHTIFKKVIFASECIGFDCRSSVDDCKSIIEKYYDDIFQKINLNFQDIKAAYVGVDTLNSYGAYFAIKKIHYCFMEMQKDFFISAQRRIDDLDDRTFGIYKKTLTELGASNGIGDVTRIVYPNSKYDLEENPDVEIFDYEKAIVRLKKKEKDAILKMFDIPADLPTGKVNALITCSQWMLRNDPNVVMKSILLYQSLLDYFVKNDLPIVIKPHPLSRVSSAEFKKYFNLPCFPVYFPSNFLPMIDDLEIVNTYTVASSGASIAKEKDYKIGLTFYRMFEIINQTDILLNLYNDQFANYSLFTYGISNEFIEKMLEIAVPSINKKFGWMDVNNIVPLSFNIIDDINWNKGNYRQRFVETIEKTAADAVVAFINSKKDYFYMDFMNPNNIDNFAIIILKKIPLKENIADNIKDKTIILYSTNKNCLNKILEYKYEKILKTTGVKLIAEIHTLKEYYLQPTSQ